jgi:hypothetical protein
MEAAGSYLKSIVLGSAVRDAPIRAEPLSVVILEVQLAQNAAEEAVPQAHEIGGVLKLRDKDEAEVNASDKGGATLPTVETEATMNSIPVIELDQPESLIVHVEAEVETQEKPTSDAAASFGGVASSPNAQVGSSGEAAGPSSRSFVSLGADMVGPSSRPFVGL